MTFCHLAHIHVDIVGPLPPSKGYKYLFTITDRNTRWPEAIPIRQQMVESCVKALTDWVSRYSIPQFITSDRGVNFISVLWNEPANSLGTKIMHTTAYNPEANGINESYIDH
ncbi:uncharacterized protein [Macrobrachium rosenbergii]|uniref:uncharacterized protein n=1 Tax=Macrobrachium rosenbergii TaxID=79674 RepID=UPI0034D4DB29